MFKTFTGSGLSAVWAGAVLSLINGILYSWSVYMLPLEQASGWTRPQTSLVFTFILVFFGLGMMCGGIIMRIIGSRLTAALGGIMLAAGLIVSSCATAPWQLILAYGVTAGFGIGMANVVPIAVGVSWYPSKRGLVCGIMAFCLAFGTLLLGSMLSPFLIKLIGIAHTLQVMGILVLVVAISASLFLKMPPLGQESNAATDDVTSLTTLQMIKTTSFKLIWLWDLALQTGGLMIIGHIVPYAVEQGASAAQASLAMGIYAIANGCGRLFFGSLFDIKGFRVAMIADALAMIAGLICLIFLPGILGFAGLLMAVVIIALSFGGTIPQFSAYIAQHYGPTYVQSNIGMTATVFFVAGFAGPFLGGYLHSITGSYQAAIFTAAAIAVPGIFSIIKVPAKH